MSASPTPAADVDAACAPEWALPLAALRQLYLPRSSSGSGAEFASAAHADPHTPPALASGAAAREARLRLTSHASSSSSATSDDAAALSHSHLASSSSSALLSSPLRASATRAQRSVSTLSSAAPRTRLHPGSAPPSPAPAHARPRKSRASKGGASRHASTSMQQADESLGVVRHTRIERGLPTTRMMPDVKRKRVLVTGGAGFVGSHLVDRLMLMGHDVIVLDSFLTGNKSSLSQWVGHPSFELLRHDVVEPLLIEVDQIFHLACPASPRHYQANQIKTIKTCFQGTLNMLGLAKRTKARFLLASTSEVYGDPAVTPQPETYAGNVSCTGPRACYDEGKRVAETLTYGYLYQDGVDVRVARIFNTYGPRMHPQDGRVVSNFVLQALRGEPLTLYGDGSQTRSFCFVHDLIDGLIALMNVEPVSAPPSPDSPSTPSSMLIDSSANAGLGLAPLSSTPPPAAAAAAASASGSCAATAPRTPPTLASASSPPAGVGVGVAQETPRRPTAQEAREQADVHSPVNLGSHFEFSVKQLAELVRDVVARVREEDGDEWESSSEEESEEEGGSIEEEEEEGSASRSQAALATQLGASHLADSSPLPRAPRRRKKQVKVIYEALPTHDPRQRRPDTRRAAALLGWAPRWGLQQGLEEMVRYYKERMREGTI